MTETTNTKAIAVLHEHPQYPSELEFYRHGSGRLTEADKAAGWTETLLYPRPTPQTSDGTGPGSWVPAEQLVQANERIAELVGALALASTRLSIAADKIERGVGRGNSRTGHAIEVRNWSGEALRAKGGAA